MSLSFSIQDYSSLFGVGFNPNTALERFQAAECFNQVRKELEKTKTRLSTLTARNFKKKSENFRKHLQEAVSDDLGTGRRRFLLSIFQDNCTTEGMWQFLLACLTLTDQQCENLEKVSLIQIFPQLLRGVAGPIAVPTETMRVIVEFVREVCVEMATTSSEQILGIINNISHITTVSKSQDTINQTGTKRVRLEGPEREKAWEGEKIEPLVFEPELLRLAEDEVLDLNNPLNVEPRHIVIQFSAANPHRMEGLLGNSPLLQAIKNSRQWRWERSREQASLQPRRPQTDCMIALLPWSTSQDFSFVIKVGHRTGWEISNYLQYDNSTEQTIVPS